MAASSGVRGEQSDKVRFSDEGLLAETSLRGTSIMLGGSRDSAVLARLLGAHTVLATLRPHTPSLCYFSSGLLRVTRAIFSEHA